MPDKPRIGITMGDPAGVGPELCLALLASVDALTPCVPIVFGDAAVLRRVARRLGLPEPAHVIRPAEWPTIARDSAKPGVLDVGAIDADKLEPGRVDKLTGMAAYAYLDKAIIAALDGAIDAIATAPIHKAAFLAAGIPYPGHTELLAARTGTDRYCMMLTAPELTCSLVTTHVGYRDVPRLLTRQRILDVIELSHAAMARWRGRPPRLIVCALNPHGGEQRFGDNEEERLIVPAIAMARERGMNVTGPLPADTAFLPKHRANTDCFICMYHDQGLIPLKALAFETAVNVTLGLPIVRTSVDHGTALDIAWQGKASAESLRRAVSLAAELSA